MRHPASTQATHDWRRWNPKAYLRQYYTTSVIPSDEVAILSRIVPYLRKKDMIFQKAIEFGAGPTLHHAVALIPYVRELHVADYLKNNLDEIRSWLDGNPSAHNWDMYIQGILKLEGAGETVEQRKNTLRSRITTLLKADIKHRDPIGKDVKYSLVSSFYCADSIADSKVKWKKYMHNLFRIIEPGGTIIVSALGNSSKYQVGRYYFPSASLREADFWDLFQNSVFDRNKLDIHEASVPEWESEGFTSVLVAIAEKNHEIV